MAIHPQFADAILAGHKRVEFRKRALAEDVYTVLIYATSPVKAIVGEFTVDGIVNASPESLWRSLGAVGGIAHSAYTAYYEGSEEAVGILVTRAQRYEVPAPLSALNPEPAVPQSFTYLPSGRLAEIRSLATAHRPSQLARFAGMLLQLVPGIGMRRLPEPIVPLPILGTAPVSEERFAARG